MNFGDYSVKKVKSFTGREGLGFNADLYRGKKKIAFAYDDASGGDVRIDWIEKGEAKLLEDHVAKLPKVNSGFEGIAPLKVDMGWFVTHCVSRFEQQADIRKMIKKCKTHTLFKHKESKNNSYMSISVPLNDKMRDGLRKQYGNDVEIFNDVLAENRIPSIFNADLS